MYYISGDTALEHFVRTQACVVRSILSWLCVRNRITTLIQANKSCFFAEQIAWAGGDRTECRYFVSGTLVQSFRDNLPILTL